MARSGPTARPGRALLALLALFVIIFGTVAYGAWRSDAQWTPKLALDLEGGTEMIMTPKPLAGAGAPKVSPEQLREAVNIIRQRVNGSGVSEAEVTTQGNNNIVVSLPGNPDQRTRDLVKQSAALAFRPVLVAAAATPTPTPTATPTPTPTGSAKATPGATSTSKPTATPKASATNGRIVPQALTKAAASPTAPAAAQNNPSATAPAASATAPADTTTGSTGTGASDLKQITPAIEKAFTAETCTNLDALQAQPDDPKKPLITCETDGSAKYILGPVELRGTDIKSANADIARNSQGFSTGQWEVQLNFTGPGTTKFAAVTERLAALTGAQNQFAIVLDQLVVSAPQTNERIPTGQAQITGNFTQASATQLASQLKFGALPVSFNVETEEQISALLGGEQLQRGLLAGLVGLVLVVLYSLLQYRALGLVTIFSLVIAGTLTFGTVLLLSWSQGYRLSLPGVTGLIVAIGITADSFIVFFERVRDEVREGRPLRSAVEAAWARARRTILVSDTVSFLAAVVLYLLAVGGVRGFAFTLGLTTLIDVIVVFLFTHPTVALLARTRFFGGGHRLSGFAPDQLGRPSPAYAGRGRVRQPTERTPGGSIAARRAAERAGEDGEPRSGPDPASDDGRVSAGRSTNGRRDSR